MLSYFSSMVELGGVYQEHDDLREKVKALQMFRKSAINPKATHWPSCRYPESALAETEILPRGKHITLSQDNSSRLPSLHVFRSNMERRGVGE